MPIRGRSYEEYFLEWHDDQTISVCGSLTSANSSKKKKNHAAFASRIKK